MMKDRLSRPLRNLRISVTDRCNFRCYYCMPEEIFGHKYQFLTRDNILTFEEVARLGRIFVKLGVKNIRLTGGEPLLRQQLEVLVEMLSGVSGIEDMAITTNGYFLKQKCHALRAAGLQRLTVSLDTLDSDLFKKMAGKHLELNYVLDGIKKACDAGFAQIKINTVVQKGLNDHEILKLADFAKQNGFIIRFIEYMDVGTLNHWRVDEVVTAREIVNVISSNWPAEPIEKNHRSEVANRYRYLDGTGEFGTIASVSQPFCGECTRARLSADGKIYTCLFANQGNDIRDLMRSGVSDEQLLKTLRSIWLERTDRYSEERFHWRDAESEKVEMYQIGG